MQDNKTLGTKEAHAIGTNSFLPKKTSDSLKGLLQLVIILSHLSFVVEGNLFFNIANRLGTSAVALFLFISGYGLTYSFKHKPGYLEGFGRHRLWAILYPFLAILGSYILFTTIRTGTLFNPLVSLKNLVLYGGTTLPNSWFVYALLLFYIFFYLSFKLLRTPGRALALLTLLVGLFVCYAIYQGWARAWWITAFAFISGCYVAEYYRSGVKLWQQLLFIFIAFATTALIIKTGNILLLLIPYLFIPIAIILLLEICGYGRLITSLEKNPEHATTFISRARKSLSKVFLNFLPQISYELYLIHGIVLAYLRPLISDDTLYSLSVLTTSIALAALYHYLLYSKKKKISTARPKS